MDKIYLNDNYVIIERNGVTYRYPAKFTVYDKDGTTFLLNNLATGGRTIIVAADVLTFFDEAGAVAYNATTLESFFKLNTAN